MAFLIKIEIPFNEKIIFVEILTRQKHALNKYLYLSPHRTPENKTLGNLSYYVAITIVHIVYKLIDLNLNYR